jgi:hypothetical protein
MLDRPRRRSRSWNTCARSSCHIRQISYLVGCGASRASTLRQVLCSHVEGIRLTKNTRRDDVTTAAKNNLSRSSLALSTDRVLSVSRSILAGLASAQKDEMLVLQIVLGDRVSPSMLPDHVTDPHSSWLDILLGSAHPASSETKTSLKTRMHARGFHCLIRIGVTAITTGRAKAITDNALS